MVGVFGAAGVPMNHARVAVLETKTLVIFMVRYSRDFALYQVFLVLITSLNPLLF